MSQEDGKKAGLKEGGNGVRRRPSGGAAASSAEEEFQTSPSTDDPVYERPERTTVQYTNRQQQLQQQQIRPAVDPSGPGVPAGQSSLRGVTQAPLGAGSTLVPPPELETVDPQSYDPFLEYLDAYPDLAQPNSGSGQFGSKPGGSKPAYPTTASPKDYNQNGYLNGIAVTPGGYSGFQGVDADSNGFVTNPSNSYQEFSTIQTNSDGYSGFIDRVTTLNPFNEALAPIIGIGADNTENTFQAAPLTSQALSQQGSLFQTIQGQQNPPAVNQGQSYPPLSNQGQGYPLTVNQGQVYPLQTNQGQAYPPLTYQGQVYPTQANLGQVDPLSVSANLGQKYPLSANQGQEYPPTNQGQDYPPPTNQGKEYPALPNSPTNQGQALPNSIGFGGQELSIIDDRSQANGNNPNAFDLQNGEVFQKGVVEDVSLGGINGADANGFLPTQRNPGRLRLPTRPGGAAATRPTGEVPTSANGGRRPELGTDEGAAAFGQIPVVRTGSDGDRQQQLTGGNSDDLDGFLDGSLFSGGDERRSKPKRKYETVSRGGTVGSGVASNTKGEPTFINIDVTVTTTTDPPASR